jgi:hypothetical protein
VQNPPLSDPPHQPQPDCKPCPTSIDLSQKPILIHWLEPYTLVEKKKRRDLDGYLFDDSCLFLS